MKSIIGPIVNRIAENRLKKARKEATRKKFELEALKVKNEITHLAKNSLYIVLGVISASFGLKGFLLPNSFIDGGVTGISLILNEITNIPLSWLLLLVNMPFIVLGFSTVSKEFGFQSIVAILLLALAVHFVPFPIVTEDKLLISVFGGLFLGLGIGLAMRGGAVLDGTEVLAIYVSKKTSMTIGDVIMVFNVLIFLIGAYIFSVEIALYALLTYLAASKTVDFVIDGIEEYIGVSIISDESEEIRLAIIENMGRGCTIYCGKKGFAKRGEELKDIEIVYTLITRLELSKLQGEVNQIDPNAFIVMDTIKDAKGGMVKKRPLKK